MELVFLRRLPELMGLFIWVINRLMILKQNYMLIAPFSFHPQKLPVIFIAEIVRFQRITP
jgi:hypothetical protein